MSQHSRQPEGDLLWEFLAVHRNLEAVTKVDMDHLSCRSFQQQIARMPVAQAQNVADHAVDRKGARVCRPPLQPVLRVVRLEPKHSVKILPCGVFQSVFEYFHLL